MIRSPARAPQCLLALGACAALLAFAGPVFAQAPVVTYVHPPDGAQRVAANVVLVFAFDRPTAKHVAYSVADLDPSSGGGLITTAPDRWSPLGDTLYVTPLTPLAYGHLFGMKLNLVQATDSTSYTNPTYYNTVHYFTTASQASVERVQAGNLSLAVTPDVAVPVPIPVRELAGTDVFFTSARVQFLNSDLITNTAPTDLDLSVAPFYEYTDGIHVLLPRSGTASLVASVRLPSAYARNIPQGKLGVRLTFYGTDETGSPVVVDAVFRVDPTMVAAHQAAVLPAIGSDILVQSAILEWPLHGATIAAGDTVFPRAVVTGNGTGAFRGAFYLDGDVIALEEGYMEAGRPVVVTMRGPLPLRRLGEHRLQFAVESPQPLAANPISIICTPPPNGIAAREKSLFAPADTVPAAPSKLRGAVTWLAEGRTQFREEDHSAVGWGGWNGSYDLGPTRKVEAEASMRVRFDEIGNGTALPQHVLVRYTDPKHSLAYGDAVPEHATETPLLMSPIPRRAATAGLHGTPLGDVEGYAALSSRPLSVAGDAMRVSDVYAGKLRRSFGKDRVQMTAYGGYTHEGGSLSVRRKIIYGGLAQARLGGSWTLIADVATVHHRAAPGPIVVPLSPAGAPVVGKSRTAWRSEIRGGAAGFTAVGQAFSYQPDLQTALNPYALQDRRGAFGQLERSFLKYHFIGSLRAEEPSRKDGQEPYVRVTTGTFATRVEMNQDSWVTPYYVHVRHKGANTNLLEDRIGGDYTISEVMGGRTTARFDATFLNDDLRAGTKRRVVSGSLVTTRKHPGRVVSTLTIGFEQNHSSTLNLTDTSIQGSFEARWEAIAGRFLVTPYLSGITRHYETLDTKDDRYSARLQLALLRVGRAENAIALEGRLDRIQHLQPARPKDFDGSVTLSIGQRFSILGR